jgi:5,10-methylenetetrahydrofolate reductase
VLGAAALGVCNVLCLSGDGVQNGDHPEAKPVFDLDSTSLLAVIKRMRDEKSFMSGRKITAPPRLFMGASANPFAPPFDYRPINLLRKVEAGAEFIQTQYCFDVPRLVEFMKAVRDMGLDKRCFVLAGVGPLPSPKTARWMRSNVPGVHIPDAVIERMEGAANPKEEGIRICIETIQSVREIDGIKGVHIMAYRQEREVPRIVEESGVLDGRKPWSIKQGAQLATAMA